MDGQRRRGPASRISLPFPDGPSVVFFCRPPYLLRIDVLGEAGRHRPVRAAQHDYPRIAHEVQRVGRGQARGFAVSAHQEEEEFAGGSSLLHTTWTVEKPPAIRP
jgi:hypothetical protein